MTVSRQPFSRQALSSTLANFGTVGERILQALPGMARNFFTVPGAAVTGKKSGVPYFSAHSAQEPLQNWPKSSSEHEEMRSGFRIGTFNKRGCHVTRL